MLTRADWQSLKEVLQASKVHLKIVDEYAAKTKNENLECVADGMDISIRKIECFIKAGKKRV
jgi:hypothetical protein